MAEQPKNFSQKAGYQGLLDFDPVNGILKYGSYEAFAKDMGVAPKREEFDFNDYLRALMPGISGAAASSLSSPIPPKMREQYMQRFMQDLQAGNVRYDRPNVTAGSWDIPAVTKPKIVIRTIDGSDPQSWPGNRTQAARSVQNLGGDKFAVDTYDIPNNVDFINKFTERAVGTTRQDNALLRQNQQDAVLRRQGAASTVLSK